MTSLRYPLELTTEATDYIQIDTFEYRTNKKWGPNGGTAADADRPKGALPIILYMPNSTPPMNNPNTWQGKAFSGPIGELIANTGASVVQGAFEIGGTLQSLGKGADLGDAARAAATTGKNTVTGILSKFNKVGPAVGQGITKAVGGMAGVSENQMLALAKGEIFNPNMELLYEGPQLRNFSLSFTFLPKSAAERIVVNQIIKHFKVHSSPSNDRGGNMFGVPNVFQVSYKFQGNDHPYMNKFKRAALADMNITYNGGLPFHSSFHDGMPVKTDMTLSFMEVDILTREDHDGAPVGF